MITPELEQEIITIYKEFDIEYPYCNFLSIEDFLNRVNWVLLSTNYKVSENFIREFHDRVSWWEIFAYQKLSLSFREEFAYKKYPIKLIFPTSEVKVIDMYERLNKVSLDKPYYYAGVEYKVVEISADYKEVYLE